MKLKTLLLGSAAAMIAVSGARAADAVIAEPEPMEYVKVCDTYGSGFHYIPGTETCLNFNGYVRLDYTYNDNDPGPSTSTYQVRARLNIDVRNETDYGTLRSQIRFQADGDASGDPNVGLDRALISLGGWRAGYSDSYMTTHHGYGLPVEKYDGRYGYDQAMFLDYTYAANGFSATVGFQDSLGASGTVANPHVDAEYYAGIAYSSSMFRIAASYLHEENTDEGSYKISARVTPVEGFNINGWYRADDGVTREVGGLGVDWSWGVGASYAATESLTLGAGYDDIDGGDPAWTVGLAWSPVPGLSIRPNVQFRENTGESYSVRVYRTF